MAMHGINPFAVSYDIRVKQAMKPTACPLCGGRLIPWWLWGDTWLRRALLVPYVDDVYPMNNRARETSIDICDTCELVVS